MTLVFDLHSIFFTLFLITLLLPILTSATGNETKNINLPSTRGVQLSNVSQDAVNKSGKPQKAISLPDGKIERTDNVSRAEAVGTTPSVRLKDSVTLATPGKKIEEDKLTGENGTTKPLQKGIGASISSGNASAPSVEDANKENESNKKNEVEISQNERNGSDIDVEDAQDKNPRDGDAARADSAKERLRDLESPEDSHFIYYLVLFGVIVAVLYIAAHNKKKILGLILEGRRPPSGSRRTSVRYRRLSQRDDTESASYRDAGSNIIY